MFIATFAGYAAMYDAFFPVIHIVLSTFNRRYVVASVLASAGFHDLDFLLGTAIVVFFPSFRSGFVG